MIKFVNDLQQVTYSGIPVFSTNKTNHHCITDIMLKTLITLVSEQINKILSINMIKALIGRKESTEIFG